MMNNVVRTFIVKMIDSDEHTDEETAYSLEGIIAEALFDCYEVEVAPVVRCKDCKHWNYDQLSEAEIEWHNCNDPLSNDGQVLTHSEWHCPNGKRRVVMSE